LGFFPQKKLEASPPADVPPWSQKPSGDKTRIHTQLHNRHHFPHNRDMRETGERHSTSTLMMTQTQLRIIDDWRRRQSDLPARAEAIRRLIQLGLMAKTALPKKTA